MKNQEYITPTKKSPVFTANCTYTGFFEGAYKMWSIGDTAGATFALSYTDAISKLHELIIEYKHLIEDYPKCKFEIEMIDGTIKEGQVAFKKVYSISASKAKKFLL